MAIFTIGTTSTGSTPQVEDAGYVGSSFDTNSWTGNIDPQTGRKLHVLYSAFANVKYWDSSGNRTVQLILGRSGFGSTDKVSYANGKDNTTASYQKIQFDLTAQNKETLLGDNSLYYIGVYSPSSSGVETTRTSSNIPIFGSGTTYHTVRAKANTSTTSTFVGNGQQYIQFYVYGMPNAGNRPTATVTGPTSVSLSWTASTAPDSRGTPTHYAVRYRVSGSSTWTSLYRTTTSTSKSISGLSPSTTYEFQVAAQNGISEYSGFTQSTGAWSTSRTATTESDIVIPAPAFSGSFSSSATVDVSYYSYVSMTDASSYSLYSGSIPPGLSPRATSTRLYLENTPTSAGTYSFRYRATNSVGVSTISPTYTINVESPPPPANPSWNSGVYDTFYVGVQYSDIVTASNATSYSLSGLLPTGLTFSTSNGLISGTPEQPESPIEMQSYTFSITAYGEPGTTPTTKSFSTSLRFPARVITNSSGGSDNLKIARKLNDSGQWEAIQQAKIWDGGYWVDVSAF